MAVDNGEILFFGFAQFIDGFMQPAAVQPEAKSFSSTVEFAAGNLHIFLSNPFLSKRNCIIDKFKFYLRI